jgi:hypothetical protein
VAERKGTVKNRPEQREDRQRQHDLNQGKAGAIAAASHDPASPRSRCAQ